MAASDTPAKVNFELSLADYHALVKHLNAVGVGGRLLGMIAAGLVSFGIPLLGIDMQGYLAGLGVGLALMILVLLRLLRAQLRLQPRPGGALLCRHEVELTSSGLRVQTPNCTTDVHWHGIVSVEETPAHVFLRIDGPSAYIVPRRSFVNAEAAQQFIAYACDGSARARAGKNTAAEA